MLSVVKCIVYYFHQCVIVLIAPDIVSIFWTLEHKTHTMPSIFDAILVCRDKLADVNLLLLSAGDKQAVMLHLLNLVLVRIHPIRSDIKA